MTSINTNYTAPSMTATGNSASTAGKTASSGKSAQETISAFLDYQKMTPEQKLRDAILKKLGMTEEQLKDMPAEERAKVEEKIKEAMEDIIKHGMAEKGMLVDMAG